MKQIQHYIGFELIMAFKAHRAWADSALARLGLRAGQEMILLQLWSEEGLMQATIAERMAVEQPTISVMLQRMEKSGLIERQPDCHDARISRAYLTQKGRDLEQPVLQIWQELEARTVEGLSSTEQVLLRRLLGQMRTNLTEAIPT